MNKIAIIIPIINEATALAKLLPYLIQYSNRAIVTEIIIVDGGSTDTSKEIALQFNEVTFISSTKGRAVQMNAGANLAKADVLYFLHADSFPPKNFDSFIINEIKKANLAGCFRMKFDSPHFLLQVSAWFTRFNYKICRGGDQSLFITKNLYKKLNGFNEDFVIYEDSEFIGRIYNQGKFKVIPKYVKTSARRYTKNGTWRLQYHFFIIHLKRRLRHSPKRLNAYYCKHIHS